jgi:RNA polymerase sigma factor (sigma-70 family)
MADSSGIKFDIRTPWTLLLNGSQQKQQQLEKLLSIYHAPVYAFYRAQGLSASDAEDCTQDLLMDFFLVRESHKAAHPAKGRFRNYLFTAARNLLADWKKRGKARRRGGQHKKVSLDALKSEFGYTEPSGKLTPEAEYEIQWAASTWRAALQIFNERHDATLTQTLELVYFGPARITQQEAAEKLGISVPAINSRLHTARKLLLQCVKEVVIATLDDPGELKDELAHLRSFLIGRE